MAAAVVNKSFYLYLEKCNINKVFIIIITICRWKERKTKLEKIEDNL